MNRKERFYTGTVLPAVVAGDGFVHLPRLLRLCGLPDVTVDSHGSLNGGAAVQLLTEYGFTESVITAEDRARYADRPRERDTPDVVAVGEDWLVAIEAKMFHRPSRAALAGQMARQRVIVDYLARSLSVPRERSGTCCCSLSSWLTTGPTCGGPSSPGSRCSASTARWGRPTGWRCCRPSG